MGRRRARAPGLNAPARGRASLVVLLGLALAVTLQLVTGFALAARPGGTLLRVHVAGGFAATGLVLLEWAWLAGTAAGRARLAGFVAAGAGLARRSEGLFLVAVSVTVALGLALAAGLAGARGVAFAPLLAVHRAFAAIVAALYLLHAGAAARARPRRGR